MMLAFPRLVLAWLYGAGFLLTLTADLGAQAIIGQLAAAKDNDEKEFIVNKTRKEALSAAELMGLARGEKHTPAVSLAFGLSLEKGNFQKRATAIALKTYAARRGAAGKAATMAALSPAMASIVAELVASRDRGDQRLAASIVATYAYCKDREKKFIAYQIANTQVKIKKGENAGETQLPAEIQTILNKKNKDRTNDEKKALRKFKKETGNQNLVAGTKTKTPATQGGLKGNVTGFIDTLLQSKDALTLEWAVLAAAHDGHADAEAVITALKTPATSSLSAARQLYLGKMGKPLDERDITAALNQSVKRDRRYMQEGPGLHGASILGIPVINALKAVGAARDKRFLAKIHARLKSHDLRVQQEAAWAMGRVGDPSSIPLLWKHLKTKPSWPVKIALLWALGENPAKESVKPLLAMYSDEKGRMRQDVAYAVLSITRGPIGPTWFGMKKWWSDHQNDFNVNRDGTLAWRKSFKVRDVEVDSLFTFYGAKIISDRLVFVLDTSKSMQGEKLDSLKKNMNTTLQTIPDFARFNVVDFGGYVKVMQRAKLIPANHAASAIQMIGYMDTTGGTRSFDAMERAQQLPEMDTILYLSDGAPVGGQFQDWLRIAYAFWVSNRYRPVAMPSILFKTGGANANGGKKSSKMSGFSARHTGHLYLPTDDM